MEIEDKTNIFFENRGTVVLVVILAVIAAILVGILYFAKQKNQGEGALGTGVENKLPGKKTLAELIKLTSAPEKNPDIKPNPALTASTSAPDNTLSAKTDF